MLDVVDDATPPLLIDLAMAARSLVGDQAAAALDVNIQVLILADQHDARERQVKKLAYTPFFCNVLVYATFFGMSVAVPTAWMSIKG